MLLVDVYGLVGALLLLIAFWLLTHKIVHSHSRVYLVLNLCAGLLLLFDAWLHKTFAGMLLNIFWILIAVYGLGWAHKKRAPKLRR